jgi:hypothetical protein
MIRLGNIQADTKALEIAVMFEPKQDKEARDRRERDLVKPADVSKFCLFYGTDVTLSCQFVW